MAQSNSTTNPGPNPPAGTERPELPALVSCTGEQVAAVFNEWNRRLLDRPEDFMDELAPDDYGDAAARYFLDLLATIQANPRG